MPFVFPESKLALYPEEEIRLPTDQQPPKGMPPVAWSAYGELRNYADAAALNQSGAPGTVLPPDYVKELRRAYYSAVSHTDDQVGKVMAALKASRFAANTVVSIWGVRRTNLLCACLLLSLRMRCAQDHGWQLGEHGTIYLLPQGRLLDRRSQMLVAWQASGASTQTSSSPRTLR